MRNREHLMMFRNSAQCIANLKSNFSADTRINLVEDESRDFIGPSKNCLEREHHARQFAARCNASERPSIMTDIQRYSKLDVFRSVFVDRLLWNEDGREFSSGHAKFQQQCIDCFREFFCRGAALSGETLRLVRETRLGRCLARRQLSDVKRSRVDE